MFSFCFGSSTLDSQFQTSQKTFRKLSCKNIFFASTLAFFPGTALHAFPRFVTNKGLENHLTAEIGVGGTAPVGSTSNIAKPGGNMLLGIGYRLNNRFSIPLEYNVTTLLVVDTVLQQAGQPKGYFNLNNIMIDPIFTYVQGRRLGGYIVGGGGFSNKQASFGETVYYTTNCDSSYARKSRRNDYTCSYYQDLASESTNQPVVDIGAGVAVRMHPGGRMTWFLESRYMKMFSPAGTFPGFATPNTETVPVTLGVRW